MIRISYNSYQKYFPEIEKKQDKKKYKKHFNLNTFHSNALEKILNNPQILGFPHTIFIEKEVPLNIRNKKIGEVDLIIQDFENNTTYYIEYKSKDVKKSRKKAKHQLIQAQKLINPKYRNPFERLLYVYGNFQIKEFKNNTWAPFKYAP